MPPSPQESLRIQDAKFASLGLQRAIVNPEKTLAYTRHLENVSAKNPILVLIHGYPQSSYEWRHLIPLLPATAPLFVPDLPGYGGSAPLATHDKLTVGQTLLSALSTLLSQSPFPTPTPTPIILIGHDRGARISHRLTVSRPANFQIQGVTLIDIVPTSTQWLTSSPSSAAGSAREITGYFHWPFLANVGLATRMITAFGPAVWTNEMIHAWAGSNPAGLQRLEADDAMAVYGGFLEDPSVLNATCEDYRAGAGVDLEAQGADQEAGRKIGAPLLVVYGKEFIGRRFDFETVWREWCEDGVEITDGGVGGGIGHFVPEEAPERFAEVVSGWLESVRGGTGKL